MHKHTNDELQKKTTANKDQREKKRKEKKNKGDEEESGSEEEIDTKKVKKEADEDEDEKETEKETEKESKKEKKNKKKNKGEKKEDEKEEEEKLTYHPDYPPKKVVYCDLCHFPIEYCEVTHDLLLKKTTEETKEESVKEGEVPNEEKKEDPKEEEGKKKKKKEGPTKVLIEQSKRGKKKHITYVTNLEKFGLVLKDVAKALSKKFACSCTVTKEETGQECITLTGEFADDIFEYLTTNYENIKPENCQVKIDKK
ncbi:MAG: hypothetical protein MJ252_07525 [archaeon]|nr:hypothetical protein [archaeon]